MLDDGGGVGTQAALAADPDDPVDDHVGQVRARDVGDHAAALREQRGQAAAVHRVPAEQQRLHARAAAGERRAGVQRVPAVVAEPTSSRTRRP